jgi:hypothetical protein
MNEAARHLDDDVCATLVLGLASPAEHEAAITHARTCVACETRLRAHAGAGVRARADRAAGVGSLRVVTSRPARTRSVLVVAATAVAAAVLAVFFFVRDPGPRTGAAPAWLTTPGELVRTRSGAPVDDALREGLAAYARHDLPTAIAALRRSQVAGGAEQARRLYLGHALLAAGETKEARTWLESVDVDALPDPWRAEARRSLAAVWRLTGRTRQADSIESAPGR